MKILKDKGYSPLLVTSGLMNDFRSKKDHIQGLLNYIKENDLSSNILLLGLIPYKDVLNLMILSQCIINPSFFEGWSSTVEESKTIGKPLILSDIKVHKEQKPEFGMYFDPNNVNELSIIMEKVINESVNHYSIEVEQLKKTLENRTTAFAIDFAKGIKF